MQYIRLKYKKNLLKLFIKMQLKNQTPTPQKILKVALRSISF